MQCARGNSLVIVFLIFRVVRSKRWSFVLDMYKGVNVVMEVEVFGELISERKSLWVE